jgi:predicted aspartyl protease
MQKRLIIGISICLIALVVGWAYFGLYMPSREKMYHALPARSFYSFTLTHSDTHIPCLQAEIEGVSFPVKLDTGYDGVLSVPKHLLEQFSSKSDAGTIFFASIQGKKYESRVYTLPKLSIGDLHLVNFPAEESNLEFERDISMGDSTDLDPSEITARVGWQAFLGTVVLIDLSKSTAICCDSLETLKERGYPLEQFASTNLLSGQEFMEFEAKIGERIVRCLLDTGSTLNLIHSVEGEPQLGMINPTDPLPPVSLSVGKRNLGPCVFHETRLPFGAQAIIGVDFLETQIVCIDLINNKLYLYPVSKDLPLD